MGYWQLTLAGNPVEHKTKKFRLAVMYVRAITLPPGTVRSRPRWLCWGVYLRALLCYSYHCRHNLGLPRRSGLLQLDGQTVGLDERVESMTAFAGVRNRRKHEYRWELSLQSLYGQRMLEDVVARAGLLQRVRVLVLEGRGLKWVDVSALVNCEVRNLPWLLWRSPSRGIPSVLARADSLFAGAVLELAVELLILSEGHPEAEQAAEARHPVESEAEREEDTQETGRLHDHNASGSEHRTVRSDRRQACVRVWRVTVPGRCHASPSLWAQVSTLDPAATTAGAPPAATVGRAAHFAQPTHPCVAQQAEVGQRGACVRACVHNGTALCGRSRVSRTQAASQYRFNLAVMLSVVPVENRSYHPDDVEEGIQCVLA